MGLSPSTCTQLPKNRNATEISPLRHVGIIDRKAVDGAEKRKHHRPVKSDGCTVTACMVKERALQGRVKLDPFPRSHPSFQHLCHPDRPRTSTASEWEWKGPRRGVLCHTVSGSPLETRDA